MTTLYETALKVCVENSLVQHPVDVNEIPLTIYGDLWNFHIYKNIQEMEKDAFGMIGYLETEYDDVYSLYSEYSAIWDLTASEMTRINMMYLCDENPPSPPPMMFHRVFTKFKDLEATAAHINEWINTKWEQVDANKKEKERLKKKYGDVKFSVNPMNIHSELDDKFETKMNNLFERIYGNRIIEIDE